MRGQLADFFRLWWGLLYWNTRKSWFRLRRGQIQCPCQSPSDSGRAFETHCDACMTWARPSRFRRVCPLLVETKDGLRCSADTAQVRPFWLRATTFYGGGALTLYLTGVLVTFIVLRSVGYPISIVHLTLPPLWHRVTETRSWFFLNRSQRAFAADKPAEGLLYLANAYEFDPQNYTAGITLAKNLQAAQPARSDQVFEKLMRDHPARRAATAQDWFRALLARGSFDRIATLSRDELLLGPAHGSVWLRALLVATRQTGRDEPLREVLASNSPHARPWREVLETELRIRSGRRAEVIPELERDLPASSPAFVVFYRVDALTRLGEPARALDLLGRYSSRLDGEAANTLVLDALATLGSRSLTPRFSAILDTPLTPPVVTTLCAHLIRYPNAELFDRLWQRLARSPLPLSTDTAGAWFSLLCAAGAVRDFEHLAEITSKLKNASNSPFLALSVIEAYFRGQTAERRINAFLPILPLPLDVTYALVERFSPTPAPATSAAKSAAISRP